MEEKYCFSIFIGPWRTMSALQDTSFLANMFAQMAMATENFRDDLQKIADEISAHMEETKTDESESWDIDIYLQAVETMKAQIQDQAARTLEDSQCYEAAAQRLVDFKDDCVLSKNFEIEKHAFRNVYNTFMKNMDDIEKTKSKYDKCMADIELTEIKQYIADTESRRHMLEEKEEELKKRISSVKDAYVAALVTGNITCGHMDRAATSYRQAWQPIVESRIHVITEAMSSGTKDINTIKNLLEKIDNQRLLEFLEFKETITPPRFKEYTRTVDNKDLSLGKHCKRKVVALQEHKNLAPNQLSFKKGDHVKQLLSPNSEGVAFGEVKGTLGKRKRGFYPASLVRTLV